MQCNQLLSVSAMQAYLETDPAARTTKDEYIMRYQQFARDDLERALQKYDALHNTIGAVLSHFLPMRGSTSFGFWHVACAFATLSRVPA